MDLGIIGLERSGKTAVFNAVTGGHARSQRYGGTEPNIGVVKVPDDRLDRLSAAIQSAKTTYVEARYLDFPGSLSVRGEGATATHMAALAQVDALVHVVRAFRDEAVPHAETTVDPESGRKSISAETTLVEDIADAAALARVLWPLCERVSARLKRSRLAGRGVVLKLKSARFRLRTRSRRLAAPTQLAEIIYETAWPLLEREADGTRFRLIGVGVDGLAPAAEADPVDLFDPARERRARAERAVDAVRSRFGDDAIGKGRGFTARPRRGRS